MSIYNAIPEIIELTITVPYTYMQVESICLDFTQLTKEDYKDVINICKSEGDTSKAYYYMECIVNAYVLSTSMQTNNKRSDLQQKI